MWQYLLTDGTRDGLGAIRTVLGEFLDGFAVAAGDAKEYFEALIANWLSDCETSALFDWRYYLLKYPIMRGGDTGIYHGVDGKLGYSMCMLRTKQLNGHYLDPILLGLWKSSNVADRVQDPWFTGYETSPRWLRLIQSGVGMRSLSNGFALQRPEAEELESTFISVCSRHEDIDVTDDGMLLKVPQTDHGEGPIDTVDRVVLGAAFLQELVAAGL